MPYQRAHWVLILLLPLVLAGFWRSYFSVLGQVPLALHVHGITATLWIVLLIVQSRLIHSRQVEAHRWAGRASLLLFPLFIVGGVMVLQTMAGHTLAPGPFMALYGARLGLFDVLALATFAGLYTTALRYRRHVQIHARCLLATPLLLLPPVLTRVIQLSGVPGLAASGPEELHLFVWQLHLTNGLVILLALALYAAAPRHGMPFLVVAGVAAAQAVAFQWVGAMPWWQSVYVALAPVPTPLLAGGGLVLGGALTAWGWYKPLPSAHTTAAAA